MVFASSCSALCSKLRRGLDLDSVSNARGRLRYSVALVTVVFMMISSFRAVALHEVVERTRCPVSAPLRKGFRRVGCVVARRLQGNLASAGCCPMSGQSGRVARARRQDGHS